MGDGLWKEAMTEMPVAPLSLRQRTPLPNAEILRFAQHDSIFLLQGGFSARLCLCGEKL